METEDLFPTPTAIPLAARVSIGRGAAIVLGVLAVIAGALASTEGPENPIPQSLNAVLVVLTLAACWTVAFGDWPHRLADRGKEVVLATLTVIPGVGLVVAYALDTPTDLDTVVLLAPIVVIGALTLRPHVFAVGVTVTLLAIAALAARQDALVATTYPLTMLVATTVLSGLAAAVLAHTLDSEHRRGEDADRVGRALRAVIDGARTATLDDPQAVLDAVVRATANIQTDTAAIYLMHRDGKLRYGATMNIPDEMLHETFSLDEGISGLAFTEDRMQVTNDYSADHRGMAPYQHYGLKAAVAVPIRVDGKPVGTLTAGRYGEGGYDRAATLALELLADHAGQALALSRSIDEDRQLLARLQSLHALQEDFVATISHELRTPITIIDGIAETIEVRGELLTPETTRAMISRLRSNTTMLNTIVTSLLDAAQLDRGLVQVDADEIDISKLVDGCLQRLEPLLLTHDVAADVPSIDVEGDQHLLERVVENLLTNAQRHTPDGTQIRVWARNEGDGVVVGVTDDGPGIAPEDLDTITDRFARGGEVHTRTTRGLGLGLALSDQILRLHGTRLVVTSPPNAGAQFSFRLRRAGVTPPG